ncbi:MAG: MerR family transcriptional regulator, repressor of the yfmOP operon [Chloroflexia bacterium]|jgi:DNA-binding transcriptional MerR regulator|nr:MerR family transcriptional regulator, repressor of the yfmOP operon [Chloroflexia bacterium]
MIAAHGQDKSSQATRPEDTHERFFLIGEVAERTGLTQRTIRYYEELGLLSPPSRTQGDFRLFSEGDLVRLKEIGRLKHLLGFSLAEIRKIVEGDEVLGQLRSEYRATEDAARKLTLLDNAMKLTEAQLELIESKMSQMEELRAELVARRLRYVERRRELEEVLAGAPLHPPTT